MSKRLQRQEKLVEIVKKQGMLSVRVLASILQVSEMTVRRDIKELGFFAADESQSKDQVANPENGREYDLFMELERSNKQKSKIGRFAASLILPGDVIAIDTGSTTARMLPHIPDNINLTVMCYNANVLSDLRYRPGVNILFGGGIFHRNTEMCESDESVDFIRKTRVNKAFLSAAGVHDSLGVTCANTYEVPSKCAIIDSSAERILLIDSSKFSEVRQAYFCELKDINTIITDSNITDEWRQIVDEMGIKLYVV